MALLARTVAGTSVLDSRICSDRTSTASRQDTVDPDFADICSKSRRPRDWIYRLRAMELDWMTSNRGPDTLHSRVRIWSQLMSKNNVLTRAHLKTPKAAAIAGIAFSALLIIILWLLRRSIPADPLDTGAWLATESRTIALALNLVPFAGIAFLWFIGVLRDRLGQQEDRFFATVFFGSALLFLAMLFAAAAR